MEKRGGSRVGSGRKKGIGLSFTIKKHIDEMVLKMFEDEDIKNKFRKDYHKSSSTRGWIYIIQNLKNKEYKIGVTQNSNPKIRIGQYLNYDLEIKLIFIDFVEDCYPIENSIHELLQNARTKGDWFKVKSDTILDIITHISKCKNPIAYNGRW